MSVDKQTRLPGFVGKNPKAEGAEQDTSETQYILTGSTLKEYIRPLISAWFAVVVGICVINQLAPPTWFITLALTYLGGWAVARQIEKRK